MSLLRNSSRAIPRVLKTLSPVQTIRKMATPAATTKFEWMVIIPDHGGMLDKRMAVRSKHFEGLTANRENGFWKMGGALLEDVPGEDGKLKIEGSAMVAYAASMEEVLEQLKKDVYAESGVWDFSKVQIWPFKCAFREKQ
ncbi:hypothetical protein BJ878DRAFT_420053 [Calycina marina]|uniref:YCII-related domain-containing protein n=1 Tax=Calycina marina TaxID=1763456 RepID=A0A9P7Z4B2_9HELO|nr:hypothetical protein BJ878DRAFT_420053 [Calycina marina]